MVNFIDFPIFTGVAGELRPWISELEEFFVRERFTAEEKMNLAQSLLEGEAESWFYTIQEMMIFHDWEELKDNLLLRFGDFSDSDRIRLIAEEDRFFQELRDAARIKRMKTTSITKKDSIWEKEPEALVPTNTIPVTNWIAPRDSILATKSVQDVNSDPVMVAGASFEKDISCQAIANIQDCQDIESSSAKASLATDESHEATLVKVEGNTTLFQILDSWEEELITQNQVPVSNLEHSLHIHNESPNVCENYQDVVGCDELGTTETMFSGLSPTSQVWEPGGVLADHVLVDWLMDFTGCDGIVDGIRCLEIGVCSGLTQPIDSRRASHVWERGGLDIHTDFMDWLMQCYKDFEFSRFMRQLHKIDLQWVRRKNWEELCVGHVKGIMTLKLKHKWRSKHLHTISALDFYISSVFPTVTSADSCSGYLRMNEQLQVHNILIATDVKFHVKDKWRLVWRISRLHNQWSVQVIQNQWMMNQSYVNSGEDFTLVLQVVATGDVLLFTNMNSLFITVMLLTLAAKYFGPFHVVERIGVMVFKDQPLPMGIAAVLDNFAPVFVIVILVVDRLRKAAHILGLTHPFKPGLAIGVPQQWPNRDTSENSWLLSWDFVNLYPPFKLEIIQAVLEQIIDKLQIQLEQGIDLHGASWHCSSDELHQIHSPIGLVDALYSGLGENVHTLPAAGQKSSSIWHRWRRKD